MAGEDRVDPALLPPMPRAPDCMMDENDVENTEFDYSDRAPDDWVSSGPLGDSGFGRGRPFEDWDAAEAWARKFYGWRYRGRKAEEPGCLGRWAFIIRGPRGVTGTGN